MWIAWELERAGYRVQLQVWDFVPGSNWIWGVQAGVRDAARTIAVLSEAYLGSVYGNVEWQAAWATDPTGRDRKLLPVRVEDCSRPGVLAGVVGFDLFGLDDAAARDRLLSEVQAALVGAVRPDAQPPFPAAARGVPQAPRFPGEAPRVWNVPPRNPNFTGRGDELDELTWELAGARTVTVQAVRGQGGVGKTALAAEYAYRHSAEYDVVWWVPAEEPALLPDRFAALLGADPAEDPEALRAQVHDELAATTGWLLIFDNADKAEHIRPWLPARPRPAGRPGHVIVTTRRSGFRELGRVLDLDVVDLADAVALMRTRIPDLEQSTAEQIAVKLERLPLALEQAGAYLGETGLPGEEYLALLRSRAADLYRRGRVGSRADTVATLWDISLERVAADSPAAIQLLEICAYLAPEPVPLDLFTVHPDLLPELLSAAAGDPVAFNDTIAVLVDYSLAKRSPAGLQMHRLVQAAVAARRDGNLLSAQLSEGEPVNAARGTTDTGWHPLAAAVRLLRVDAPAEVMGSPASWPRWKELLPHVLAAAEFLDDGQAPGSGLMEDASWLIDRAGTYHQVHARLDDALPLMRRALDIAEATYDRKHPEVATRLNNLAAVLHDLGRPREARPLLERAVDITEAAYGPNHPYVAASLGNLAMILRDLGQPREARPLAERALEIDEAAYGPDHPTVAIRQGNLAAILRDLGRP